MPIWIIFILDYRYSHHGKTTIFNPDWVSNEKKMREIMLGVEEIQFELELSLENFFNKRLSCA